MDKPQKQYYQAPLPFIGQKRMFIKSVVKLFEENIPNEGEGWTIIDVFGGSGLLSHTAKFNLPKAKVIYNDFDDYSEMLAKMGDIEALRSQLLNYLESEGVKNHQKLSTAQKMHCLRIIEEFEGFKDWGILTSWLLFSGNESKDVEKIKTKTFYHSVRKTPLPNCDDYLNGVEIVKMDFRALMQQFQHQEKVLFLLDPPYLCTKQDTYSNARYFDLVDFLELMALMGQPYLFFSSTKSEILRYLDFAKEYEYGNYQAFDGAQIINLDCQLNRNAKYQDNLIYNFFNQPKEGLNL